MRHRAAAVVVALAVCAASSRAHAGVGHWLAGERATAKRLGTLQLIGLGAAGLSGATLAVTGGSRWLSPPGIPIILAGGALFVLGAVADLYGVITGGRALGGDGGLGTGIVQVDYAYVHDPQFAYRNFTVLSSDIGSERWRLRPRTWLAMDDDNQRVRAELVYRVRPPRADGSYLEAGGALTFHRYGDEGFTHTGAEAFATGRLDLQRLGRWLRGSFAELSLGLGVDRLRIAGETDLSTQLLGRFGFGVYTGAGEVQIYYDHRRDDYAGGLAVPRVAGFLGHVGLMGHHFVSADWAVAAQLEVGSAYIGRVGLLRRFGAPR